jgi:outer membrane protein
VEHNIELQQQTLGVESAEIDLNTSRNSRLPNISAGAGQNFGFGRGTVRYKDPETGETYDRYEDTQSASTSLSASVGIPVFQGFRINHQIKADELNLKAAVEGLEKAKQNLELAVASYFLDVLFNREMLMVYEEQLELSKKQLVRTEEMVRAEKVARSQMFEMQAEVANAEVAAITARNNLNTSLLNLSQVLNLEYSPSFDIAEPDMENFIAANLSSLLSPESIYNTALDVKPHIREAEYRLQGSEWQVKIARAARYPSLNLSANVNTGYQYLFGQKFYDRLGNEIPQIDFASQMRDQLREGVGLNLSIPIFNGFRTRNSVRSARIGVRNQTLALEGVKLALYKEIQQAYQSALAAEAKFSASEKAMNAAGEAFRAIELKYEYGAATVYEFSEAQTRLIESRSDGLQAKYEFLFSTEILDFYHGKPIGIE